MDIDVMTGAASWADQGAAARRISEAGFSGMLFTETSQVPWMQIAAASMAAPDLHFSTGIAVAFPRSPMVSAAVAYELAANTGGRFRLGLGSQVKAHITRRYGADFDRPAARLADYVEAVRACFAAFSGEARLDHHGEFYDLTLLPRDWSPSPHDHPMKIDISAVGPVMTRVAGRVADGIHVHPLHSMHYIEHRLLPAVAEGAAAAGRSPDEVDLIIPVFTVTGDTDAEIEADSVAARRQIAFYGTTPNYAFQFDDLGFDGVTSILREKMKAGDIEGMGNTITDEMLDRFAVVARWDDLADRLIERYRGTAHRLVMYSARSDFGRHAGANTGADTGGSGAERVARWADVAAAVRAA